MLFLTALNEIKSTNVVFRIQDMCKMATEAITSGQTSVKAELRRTANTRERLHFVSFSLPLNQQTGFSVVNRLKLSFVVPLFPLSCYSHDRQCSEQ